jgi:hypothetical protein
VTYPPTAPAPGSARAQRFTYDELEADPHLGELRCRYSLDGQGFVERVGFEGVDPQAWALPGVEAAARWVFLLLGVSYYKAGAPPVVDLGDLALSAPDVEFLRQYYIDGLGEFAYRNGIDLSELEIRSRSPLTSPPPAPSLSAEQVGTGALRPLIPFGGGIDSIVTTELVRHGARGGDDGERTALFVVSKAGDRFAAIEAPAAVTGLPILRAERELDRRILRSSQLGFLNGHVPVTGMISAIAVLAALLHGRDAVVMSNEASASAGNLDLGDRVVNHQWSKGLAFETAFRDALVRNRVPVEYFSLLRSASELWVGRHFAALTRYHGVFRSCNRAFYVDAALRMDHWCGECDKCCFVDLILAPFMERARLEEVFDDREPLANDALADRFRTLLGISPSPKPFDCVGDPPECRAALRLTAERADRVGDTLVHRLLAELPDEPALTAQLLEPAGPNFVPDAYAPGDLLV